MTQKEWIFTDTICRDVPTLTKDVPTTYKLFFPFFIRVLRGFHFFGHTLSVFPREIHTACTYAVNTVYCFVIINFFDQTSEDIFNGVDTKQARRISSGIWRIAVRKLDLLNAAHELKDLRIPPSNRLEALKGNLKGKHSIRINDQYRIVFEWSDGNAKDVQIIDYH